MISICLTRFLKDPWSQVMMKGFLKALKKHEKLYKVEEIFGYPNKKYDLIVLIGIRSIVKRNLDKNKILPYCEKLIDMGDSSMDPRKNEEDIYFYFSPSNKKLYKHYEYLPKFVLEEHLYPSQETGKLNVYVDHYKAQSENEREISIKTINKIFEDIRNSEVPLNVFYHTSKGIEKNRLFPEIPDKGVPQCAAFIPFETISKYYRKTDIFFPTHRETQGMLAQEIGACGGLTVLQEWMYPKFTHYQFPNIFYNKEQKIDFLFLKSILEKSSKTDLRKHVLKNCSFKNFEDKLNNTIGSLFKI